MLTIILAICIIVAFFAGYLINKTVSDRQIGAAKDRAAAIIDDAKKDAEHQKKEMLFNAKEEAMSIKDAIEKENRDRRSELQKMETRLMNKEENLDRKTSNLDKTREKLDRRSRDKFLTEESINQELLEFLACDESPKALLLVYDTVGSTPVKSGAMMAVDRLGRTVGTIGGGCSENAVLGDARRIIGTHGCKCVTVDMSNDLAAEEGMVCGGRMKVLIEDVSP